MKTALYYFITAAIIAVLLPVRAFAQSAVTFRVDMREPIKENNFVPSEDNVFIKGNQLPFSSTRMLELEDKAPKDSIYAASVQFSSIVNGKNLSYHFLIRRGSKKIDEQNNRSLVLSNEDIRLPVVGFNEQLR